MTVKKSLSILHIECDMVRANETETIHTTDFILEH